MNRTEIRELLPNVFQQTLESESTENREENVLALLIDVMYILHADIDDQLKSIENYFNPCRSPQDNFIDYLGRWADLDRLCNNSNIISRDCFQELIASAAYLSQWRGTKKGLCKFLKIATGSNFISIKEGVNKQGEEQSFHFLVQLPESQKHQLKLIKTIIEQEKPVYISYEFEFITE